MKNSKLLKQMLAGPYLLWSAAFIIIPLIMVFYYGLTNNDGGFTLMNLARITEPENLKALGLALLLSLGQYDYLPDSRIPSGYDPDWTWRQSVQLYRTDFHPANVDEFFASDHCMAEPVGKERSYQQSPSFFPFTGTGNHQYSICHRTWYGL